MSEFERLQLFADDGLLDGTFDLENDVNGVAIVLHARGGSRPGSTTNRDYFKVLELVLERMATSGLLLSDVRVDSRPARQLPLEERRVPLGYPVDLREVGDLRALRVQITEAQPDIATLRPQGAPGGNKHKRLRLVFSGSIELRDAKSLLQAGALPDKEPTTIAFGAEYFDDPTDPNLKPSKVFVRDDMKLERSLASHARTQRLLALRVRKAGLLPKKRGPSDPDFDVGWFCGQRLVVAEVKSLPALSATAQLRTG